MRVEPVWGLLVIISFISGHSWPAQSYHLSFRTKKSKNWRKSATSWLPSWERLTEFPLFAQWICVWLLLSWPQLSCLIQELLPLRREKHFEKAHPAAAYPALLRRTALAEPGSVAPSPKEWQPAILESSQHRPWSGRQAATLGLWFLCFNSFFLTAMYFINIFSHHSLTWTAYSPILQRFPLPHIIHSRGI